MRAATKTRHSSPSVMLWIILAITSFIHLHLHLCAPSPRLTTITELSVPPLGIMIKYSTLQLVQFVNYSIPSCIPVIKQLGLLRRRRYIHRSSRRKFVFFHHGQSIPSIWSPARSVAPVPRHLNASPTGSHRAERIIRLHRKPGPDYSAFPTSHTLNHTLQ